jgi:shikimate dehydrogenase
MYKLGVIGNPIAHSLSPVIHQHFAQQTNVDLTYQKILAPVANFKQVVQEFMQQGADGFNVTVPFKLDAFAIADELSANAKIAGSVNTIKLSAGKLIGENTDGDGLVRDLTQNLKINLADATILLLGAGGASQGILYALLQQKPKRILIANRTLIKALKLKGQFARYGKTCGFTLDKVKPKPVDIIINATSASLDNQVPNITPKVLNGAICYDLMYGKDTAFLHWARQNNAKMAVDGLGMLVEQAASSFEFWTGKTPATAELIQQLRANL